MSKRRLLKNFVQDQYNHERGKSTALLSNVNYIYNIYVYIYIYRILSCYFSLALQKIPGVLVLIAT